MDIALTESCLTENQNILLREFLDYVIKITISERSTVVNIRNILRSCCNSIVKHNVLKVWCIAFVPFFPPDE